ncbi:MAG: protoheme IX farnesyltransferase [Anaerolineae bacterium]
MRVQMLSEVRAQALVRVAAQRLGIYASLTKGLQTGLLVITGMAGYNSTGARGAGLGALAGSLALAIAGSTLLNMAYDRDIDVLMARTVRRPLPMGIVSAGEVLVLGLVLTACGLAWALYLAPLYGLVVLAGVFFDVIVYTLWLKRRSPWSIIWGGVAGGMPVLAGRVLGVGRIDAAGLLLAGAVLLWIPTHILSLSLRRAGEYACAGVPVLPNTHGQAATRRLMALSAAGATVALAAAGCLVSLPPGWLYAGLALGAVLLSWSLLSLARPSARRDWLLFKLASLYMLGWMALFMAGI